MHIMHNVQVHNGGLNDMEYYLIPPFVISPLQSLIFTKLILNINFVHVFLVLH
jgi:hypothetical protein